MGKIISLLREGEPKMRKELKTIETSDIKVEEVKKDKLYKIRVKGLENPIRVLVDERLSKERTFVSPLGIKVTAIGGTYYDVAKRTIRIPREGISKAAFGHELGHAFLQHGETGEVDKKFIREELEAEYWAYDAGFPRRRWKIKELKLLAKDVGITEEEFKELEEEVRKRLYEK